MVSLHQLQLSMVSSYQLHSINSQRGRRMFAGSSGDSGHTTRCRGTVNGSHHE